MSMLRRESRRANTWRSKSMERRISKRSRSSSSTERERSRSKERGRHKSMKRQRNKRRRRSSSTERERSSSKEREIHKSRKRQRNKRRRRSSSTERESSRSKERGRHKSTKRQRNKRRRRSKDGKKSNEMGKKRRSREGMKKSRSSDSRSSRSSDSRNRSRSKESSSSPMDQVSSDEDLSCEPKFYKHQCMVFTVNRVRMSETFKYILKNIGALTARGKKSRIVFLRGSHGSETGDDGLRNKELIDEQLYTQFCELLGLHRKSRTFQNITKVSHTKELEWRTRQIKADVTDEAKANNDKTKTKKQKDCLKESIRKNGELFLKEGIPAVK